MKREFGICLLALCIGMSSIAPLLFAHEEESVPAEKIRVLGEISFPTTATSPEAQKAFIRGMLLLHLFEYPFAREEFLNAQKIEPDFAMAYWGEAMTYNHPIWDQQNLEAGRAALQKLGVTHAQRMGSTSDLTEKGFLQAIEILYGQGSKADRDKNYARAMERLAARFPENHEVQLFYALALFGVQAGVRDIPTYMLCTAIAQSVFTANPLHPGAAHYLIHGVDDPDHAVLGLAAARALARMAPDAGHSLHMTSHIFTALGMWDDVVVANESAVRVQNQMGKEHGLKPRHWGHYNFWLLYGYLQQGRVEQAQSLLKAAFQEVQDENRAPQERMNLDPDGSLTGSVVQMWARYLIETRDWTGDIAQWNFKMGDAFDPNLNFTFIQGMRAAYAGQAALAGQYLLQFRQLQSELKSELDAQQESAPTDQLYLKRLEVLEKELLAGIDIARGDYSAAVRNAGEASRSEGEMPFSFGPPFVDLPAAELHAELLFKARKYDEAAAAFETELKRARLRARSLLGLARTRHRMGQEAEASYSLEKLRGIWSQADAAVREKLNAPDDAAP